MPDSGNFFADARSGRLPGVSFVKASGAHDEHPADFTPRWGEQWVMRLLRAVGEGPAWQRTAVIVTYDEGGGFSDHVPRRGDLDHRVSDTSPVPAFIETRLGLRPLPKRDAEAYNLLDGLAFSGAARALRVG